jgi:hypothetical protein
MSDERSRPAGERPRREHAVARHVHDEPPAGERCDRCGRLVRETMHQRGRWVVDAYVLHTGETEPAVVRRPDSEAIVLEYQRLVRPVVVVTCADCYADPAARRRHESWAYPPADTAV